MGDEIQTMKSGLIEIGDIFVVNKADRPGADLFATNLRSRFEGAYHNTNWSPSVIKTVALENKGIDSLMEQIKLHNVRIQENEKKLVGLTNKAYLLIQNKRMKEVKREVLYNLLKTASVKPGFNLYSFTEEF